MATIYRSGISRGLVTVIALVLLPVYALMIYLSVWIGLALLVILTALIVDTLVNTRYTIDHKTLRVQSGLFDKRQFDIDRITEIAHTTSLESAPAASLNRICLRLDKRQTLILSPRQQQAFIDHLLRINPRIIVKPSLSASVKQV